MRTSKYVVSLSPDERQKLEAMQRKGKHSVRELKRAQVLLLADEGKPNADIQRVTGLSEPTVIAIKKRYCTEGLNLKEKPRPGAIPKLDSRQESYLIALACTDAPEGRDVWTMQLLADRLVELKVVDAISDETVRRALKKRSSSPGRRRPGALAK